MTWKAALFSRGKVQTPLKLDNQLCTPTGMADVGESPPLRTSRPLLASSHLACNIADHSLQIRFKFLRVLHRLFDTSHLSARLRALEGGLGSSRLRHPLPHQKSSCKPCSDDEMWP